MGVSFVDMHMTRCNVLKGISHDYQARARAAKARDISA
jgi:hypothetical protein